MSGSMRSRSTREGHPMPSAAARRRRPSAAVPLSARLTRQLIMLSASSSTSSSSPSSSTSSTILVPVSMSRLLARERDVEEERVAALRRLLHPDAPPLGGQELPGDVEAQAQP